MEQLMERPIETSSIGPRHARSVTKMDRLKWALNKGPARWDWKANFAAMLFALGVLVGVGVALVIGLVLNLAAFKAL